MATDPEVLDFLRAQFARVNERIDGLALKVEEQGDHIAMLQQETATLHQMIAGQAGRLDRIEARLDRLERRLALPRPAAKGKAMTDPVVSSPCSRST